MDIAEKEGFDLVEVAPNARPPVCRLMDYGKFKYTQKQKAREAKKHQTHIVVKEVKLRLKTDDHDVAFKMRHIRRFLGEGNKAKVTMVFRGREFAHRDRGMMILRKVAADLAEEADVESSPRMEGRTMNMILVPKGKPVGS